MKLIKNFATVGMNTLLSRIFGFLRDILYAGALGAGMVSDTFLAAFRFPNLFRRIFAEGAFNAAFVPLYTKKLSSEGKASAEHFASQTQSGLALVLILVTIFFEITMPWAMYLLAPGFEQDPEKFELAIRLSQITFPYLLCMSLLALASGVLNAHRRFVASSIAPVLLNIILCGALLGINALAYQQAPAAGYILSIAVTIAGFIQLGAVWIALRRANIQVRFRRPRWNKDMRQLVRLGVPGTIAGGITQINIMIGTLIASLQAGGISYLYYADRIYQLPLGIVGAAVGVVLLPELSRRIRKKDFERAHQSQNRSFDISMALTIPAAAGLFLLADPIIATLYQRAAFTAQDTALTSPTLAAFAVGLPAFVLIKVFQPGFFSREDTHTPMVWAGINMAVNVVVSLALYSQFAHVGIAIATSLAGWVNALGLGIILLTRGDFRPDSLLLKHSRGIIFAVSGMSFCIYVASYWSTPWFQDTDSSLVRASILGGLIVMGIAAYSFFVVVSRAVEISDIRSLFRQPEPEPAPSTTPGPS